MLIWLHGDKKKFGFDILQLYNLSELSIWSAGNFGEKRCKEKKDQLGKHFLLSTLTAGYYYPGPALNILAAQMQT